MNDGDNVENDDNDNPDLNSVFPELHIPITIDGTLNTKNYLKAAKGPEDRSTNQS